MVESYRFKSKLSNVLVFVFTFITFIGVDGLTGVLPVEYKFLASGIVAFAGWYVVQYTEDTRVSRAEELVHDEYKQDLNYTGNTVLNDEYVTSGDTVE